MRMSKTLTTGHQWTIGIIVSGLCICLMACQPTQIPPSQTPPPEALPSPAWGTVERLGQAEQLGGASIAWVNHAPFFTWTGVSGTEARHYARNTSTAAQIIAFAAAFPQRQRLFPLDDGVVMLWLDRSQQTDDLRLQAGRFSEDGVAEIGAVLVSDQRTLHYDAIGIDENVLQVVWSGGLGDISTLYVNYVDHLARTRTSQRLRIDADYPALLLDADGNQHLFWLENNRRDVYYGQLIGASDPTLTAIRRVASSPLQASDDLAGFSAAYDGETAYLLWNIRQIDDVRRVMLSYGELAGGDFSPPQPLQLDNTDTVQWAVASDRQEAPMPILVNVAGDLRLLTLNRDEVVQDTLLVDSGTLLGLPALLLTDTEMIVTWAQARDDGWATLYALHGERDP